MSLWGDVDNFFTGSGSNQDLSNGYNQAQGSLGPWAQGGQNAFNQWQQNTTNQGNYLNSFQNMGAPQWQASQMSAPAYYQSIMSGYQQSPQAAYAQQMAARAGNAAGAASGMMGSGAFVNGQQRNANQISQGDQQQYFNNVMGANQAQMGDLQNYQNQNAWYNNMLQNQSQMGLNAANQMSQNSMQNGQNMANQNNINNNNEYGMAGALINGAMSWL